MADWSPFILVLITAVVSGTGGYVGNVLRGRSAARTAARLVHAELLQNAAGLIYYRDSGRLLPPALRRAAWDQHSQALAQLRDATLFTEISDSYQALEAATYIAEASKDQIPDDLRPVLED